MSASKKRGEFNSPRHPARYPSNLTCTYNFILAGPHESARLYFDQFKVRANDTTVFYGYISITLSQKRVSSIIIRAQPIVVITRSDRSYCQEDWVEIYNVFPAGREILLGRYCGDAFPGPVESEPGTIGLKVFDHFFFLLFCFLACPAIGANAATLSLDFLRLSCTRTKKASLTASRPGTCSTRTSRSIEVRERELSFPGGETNSPRVQPLASFLPSFLLVHQLRRSIGWRSLPFFFHSLFSFVQTAAVI